MTPFIYIIQPSLLPLGLDKICLQPNQTLQTWNRYSQQGPPLLWWKIIFHMQSIPTCSSTTIASEGCIQSRMGSSQDHQKQMTQNRHCLHHIAASTRMTFWTAVKKKPTEDTTDNIFCKREGSLIVPATQRAIQVVVTVYSTCKVLHHVLWQYVHPMTNWEPIYSTNVFFRPREVKKIIDNALIFPGMKYFKERVVCHKCDKHQAFGSSSGRASRARFPSPFICKDSPAWQDPA